MKYTHVQLCCHHGFHNIADKVLNSRFSFARNSILVENIRLRNSLLLEVVMFGSNESKRKRINSNQIKMPIYISIIIPFFSALFGGFITFYYTSKSKKEDAILKFKEEKYSNLLILIQGFIGDTANAETKRKFFDEQYKSWIYSSDEVVISINKLVEMAKENSPNIEEGRKAIGNIVLAMRKDLLKKTDLTYKDFSYTNVCR